MSFRPAVARSAVLALSLAACSPPPSAPPAAGAGGPPRPPSFDFAPGGPIPDAQLGQFHAVLECEVDGRRVGDLAVELWPDAAPLSVRRFLRLCDEGWYDGTRFSQIDRDYVIRGGDPAGEGHRAPPYAPLPAEVSLEPRHAHHYGVFAMAEPPSMAFLVCVAESNRVWALDLAGTNTIGKLAAGVHTLETLADVPIRHASPSGLAPRVPVVVRSARVERGAPPATETIERPRPDLGGQPERIGTRYILVTFLEHGQHLGVTRNRVEAAARARECYERLRSGELDFEQARDAYSDEEYPEGTVLPVWRLSNYGVFDPGQRARADSLREMSAYQAELRARLAAGEIDAAELEEKVRQRSEYLGSWVRAEAVDRREEIGAPGYAEVAFGLEVGEVGLVPYDPIASPAGFYVVERVE